MECMSRVPYKNVRHRQTLSPFTANLKDQDNYYETKINI